MNTKKQQILFLLAKLPLLVLYALFFTVQLFFNFDTGQRPGPSVSFHKNIPCSRPGGIKKAQAPADSKFKFRLNKRYQPGGAITCTPLSISPANFPISSNIRSLYKDAFVSSSVAAAHLLRGPPVFC